MTTIKVPGWDEFHETHRPFPIENGGVLWIPTDITEEEHPKAVLQKDSTDWTEALLAALKTL